MQTLEYFYDEPHREMDLSIGPYVRKDRYVLE